MPDSTGFQAVSEMLTLTVLCCCCADGLSHLLGLAEQHGLILLSPDSKGSTWDFLRDGFGPDVAYINTALQHVFSSVRRYSGNC